MRGVRTQPAITVRPMNADDIAAADELSWRATRGSWPAELRPDPAEEPLRAARGKARIAHLLETDPGGAFVAATGDGKVTGVALAIVRERLWALSLLAVDPDHQARGIGIRLLDAAAGHSAGCAARLLLSSSDPRALRAYHRLGLAIRPLIEGVGELNRARIPARLQTRAGDPGADAELIDHCSRHVRGASHLPDIQAAMRTGCELLVVADRGFALARDGVSYLVCALDEEAASDLTWSALALAGPGEHVAVTNIGPGNDWALRVVFDAGLTPRLDGALFSDGLDAPLAPYLPSGAYL